MQHQDLTELINACKMNNAQAFRKLVETHQAMVYSLAFRMICNEDEAKDIVQETFIRVWKHLDKYNTEMKFTTWLFSIASHLCYDRLKAIKRKSGFKSSEAEYLNQINIQSEENIEASAINSELANIISGLTDKLTPKQRLIFTLRDLEGLEVEDVEIITGLSAAKIKSNLYLARQFIKGKLEKM